MQGRRGTATRWAKRQWVEVGGKEEEARAWARWRRCEKMICPWTLGVALARGFVPSLASPAFGSLDPDLGQALGVSRALAASKAAITPVDNSTEAYPRSYQRSIEPSPTSVRLSVCRRSPGQRPSGFRAICWGCGLYSRKQPRSSGAASSVLARMSARSPVSGRADRLRDGHCRDPVALAVPTRRPRGKQPPKSQSPLSSRSRGPTRGSRPGTGSAHDSSPGSPSRENASAFARAAHETRF